MEIDKITFQLQSATNTLQLLDEKLVADKDSIIKIVDKLQNLSDAKNILTILKNYKMESKKDFILNTINTALHDVFAQNLKIDIEATSATSTGKINMKYDIVLYQNDVEMARNEKLLGNNGGGVLSFISILFKVLVGYIYSDNKFFLFDESISQVSSLYRPRLAQFLQKFCQEYDFTLVLISQTDDIDEYADCGYLLDGEYDSNGIPKLIIDKVLGEYPKDKYVYSKIENFQSIVKLEFRYKGFTIIRGNNNIGKSASFRAVNAILFNSFDSKDHPRKKRPRGAETKIRFGFYDSAADETDVNISLKFKSNKVIYSFDDLEFSGKQLSFDKVKEKVESIGFKYVDLKETYKNFKGNLKEQTERLAMTTQHDGFYLVGNKSNETEKVFNFLFDSTDVANAISTISQDIREVEILEKTTTENIRLNEKEIIRQQLLKDMFTFQYYNILIYAHISRIHDKGLMVNTKDALTDTISNIDGYVMITAGLSNYESCMMKKASLKKDLKNDQIRIIDEIINTTGSLEKIRQFKETSQLHDLTIKKDLKIKQEIINIDKQLTILNEISSYAYYVDAIKTYNIFKNNEQKNFERIKTIDQKSIILSGLIDDISMVSSLVKSTSNITALSKSRDLLLSSLALKNEESLLIIEEFGICECDICHGTGYKEI